MGGAPVIETVRLGVQFTPAAAASFRRAELSWGRPIRCNSTYRDYGLQLSMWQAWNAWTEGRGPKPNHSRALHPDASVHCRGEALDTPDWSAPGFIAHMARHGWIRTAAGDPTEQHHFEYQSWRDQYRNEFAGGDATPFKEEDMPLTDAEIERIAERAAFLTVTYPIPMQDRNGNNVGEHPLQAVLARATAQAEAAVADINYIHQVSPVSLYAIREAQGSLTLSDEQARALSDRLAEAAVQSLDVALRDDFDAVKARLADLPAETIAALKAAL